MSKMPRPTKVDVATRRRRKATLEMSAFGEEARVAAVLVEKEEMEVRWIESR